MSDWPLRHIAIAISSMNASAAYRVRTKRLLLRCWNPAEAPQLVRAIEANMQHLMRWLPWMVGEPETVEAKADRLRKFRTAFDRGQDYIYGMFTRDESRLIGAVGGHGRIGAGAREFGYWISEDCARQGLMSEAVAALTRQAFEHDRLHRVEIHCHPENLGSSGVPRKLGFTKQLTMKNCFTCLGVGPRDSEVWSLTRAQYSLSAASAVEFEAFDQLGRPLPGSSGRNA
jgi:RimJ/RimL family protein N-acetyltransferase